MGLRPDSPVPDSHARPGSATGASTAVERYIGSYLGTSNAELAALGEVAVSVDVICVKTRRIAKEIAARSGESGAATAGQNAEAMLRAFGEATSEVVAILKQGASPCEVLR